MRARLFTLAGIAILAVAAPVRAEPGTIRQAIESARMRCASAGGHASPGAGFISTVDLNRDRKPDYVLDLERFGCRTKHGNPFCTGLGCQVRVFLSTPGGGYESAFEGSVKGWRVRGTRGRIQFQIALLGAFCPSHGPNGCSEHREANGTKLTTVGYSLETFRRDPPPQAAVAGASGPGGDDLASPNELIVPGGPFVPSGAGAPVRPRDLSTLPFVP
jgi:hypothetical protein